MSQSGFDSKFTIAAIQETMLKFHWYGFHTVVTVVNGASSNLSMIKIWTAGDTSAYGVAQYGADKHYVKTWFVDAFNGQKVFCIICPSHQVCNCQLTILFTVCTY